MKPCERCGCARPTISHHIIPLRDWPDQKEDIENRWIICKSCHRHVHLILDYFRHGLKNSEWIKAQGIPTIRFICDLKVK